MMKIFLPVTLVKTCVLVTVISLLFVSDVSAQPPSGGPPQEAFNACSGLRDGDACTFNVPHGSVEGRCAQIQGALVCKPEGGPPSANARAGASRRDRAAVLPYTIQEADVRLDYFSSEDGLSHNSVTALVQDRRGFLWIGTQDGLNRYDAYEFKVYTHKPKDAHSLSDDSITALFEDADGLIWIATKKGGLNRYDSATDHFTHFAFGTKGESDIEAVFRDSTGTVWCGGSEEQGLQTLDPQTGLVRRYLPDFRDPYGFHGGSVRAITEARDGHIWIAADSSLERFDPRTGHFSHYPPPSREGKFRAVIEDLDGKIWTTLSGGGDPGLYKFEPDTQELRWFHPGMPVVPSSMSIDSAGMLWLGLRGKEGLYQFDPESERFLRHFPHGADERKNLAVGDVTVVYEGEAGLIWVGTSSGLNLYDPQQKLFHHYGHDQNRPNTLAERRVSAIAGDSSDVLWLGTESVLNRLDSHNGRVEQYSPPDARILPPGVRIQAIYCDRQGAVWFILGNRLYSFVRETQQFRSYLFRESLSEQEQVLRVTQIYADRDEALWFGVEDEGLFRFDPIEQHFQHYQAGSDEHDSAQSLITDEISALYQDRYGLLWIGSKSGVLSRFDSQKNEFFHYQHDSENSQSISPGEINAMYEDSSGIFWVASSDGLQRFERESGEFRLYTEDDGLPNTFVQGILEDQRGRLWLSTQEGLLRFESESEHIRSYDIYDGLHSNEFERIAWQNSDGQMFFGGQGGITAFYPDQIRDTPSQSPLVFTDFQLFNKAVPIDGEDAVLERSIWDTTLLRLDHHQNVISFGFTLLSYAAAHKNRYRYLLEGFEQEWNEVDSRRRSVSYTSLPPGEYVLRVQGANHDGLWSSKEAALTLIVLPPWWLTWWAYAGYGIMALGFVWGYGQYRSRSQHRALQQKERELAQERMVSERLQRIDHLKDAFLANTSHELRTPLNGIIGLADSLLNGAAGAPSIPMQQNLRLLVASAQRLASLVDDILDFSKLKQQELVLQPKALDMQVSVDVALALLRSLSGSKELELINDISPDSPAVLADENRVQQILHNLVGNAMKFSESGQIRIAAEQKGDMLDISVSDQGIGIQEEQLARIFESFEQADSSTAREYGGTGLGLSVTKQLVELHGGHIRVESTPGQGSCFSFTLPLTSENPSESFSSASVSHHTEQGDTTEQLLPTAEIPVVAEQGFRILIVDDEAVNQQVLMNYLSMQGYRVLQAFSGSEALQILNNGEHFDLVLLDIMMPRMSGYEVALKIRQTYLPSELPIIMLTAKDQVTDLVEGFSAGANDYLTKPLSRQELLARIKTHLNLLNINNSYSRFVPFEFMKELGRETILDVKLGDQVHEEMTVLFSDIRAYTTLAETMDPQDNFNFLNAYLGRIGPIIRGCRGFVNQYYGDGMMALFPQKPEDAVRAAIQMQCSVANYNKSRRQKGRQPIEIGIGLNTGKLMLGIIGDGYRTDTGVVADSVNTTARLEGLTKQYGVSVIISGSTFEKLPESAAFHIRFLDKVQVKGKERVLDIYEVFDADPPELLALKQQSKAELETGQQRYFAKEFVGAVESFKRVLAVNPGDPIAALYLTRSRDLLTDGVPEGWEGVEKKERK